MKKSVKLDLPYPSLDCICEDYKSVRIISPAYASAHGELAVILQYAYHALYFDESGDEETANLLDGIAITEMHHLEILGSTLLKLGADPVYTACPPFKNNFYNTSKIAYSKTKQKMLLDDLAGEIYASESYGKMLDELCNERVAAIIARIKLDEDLHIKVLKERLSCYC